MATGIEVINQIMTGRHAGISILASKNTTISNSIFISNEYGIMSDGVSNVTIIQNYFNENTNGISLAGTSNSEIRLNHFQFNRQRAINLVNSRQITVSSNNLVNNVPFSPSQVHSTYCNYFGYNYWNNWLTPDNDGDGIVDLPYNIDTDSCDNLVDETPVVQMYVIEHPEDYSDLFSSSSSTEVRPTETDESVNRDIVGIFLAGLIIVVLAISLMRLQNTSKLTK